MKIEAIRALRGPNIFANFPVLKMTLDLESLADTSSASLPGFVDRLLATFPGVAQHRCSRGHIGGFVERLREGTYFGHIVEHLALEMSGPAGIDVSYGKTVFGGRPGLYDVVVEFEDEEAMRLLLEASARACEALVGGEPFDVIEPIEQAKRIAAGRRLGPSTNAIVRAASRRDIPWRRLNDQSLVVLGYGRARKFIQATTASTTSVVGVDVASNKQLTKELVAMAGVPVPRGRVVRTADAAVQALYELGGPVVVKPLDGNQGKGVSLNLRTEDEVRGAFELAQTHRSRILVEEMVVGENFRVLVVGGRMIAAAERLAAHVVGDGVHTARELVELENANPLRGKGHGSALSMLALDDVVDAFLSKTGRTLEDIPASGDRFFLRESANLSTGGVARDVTDLVHPATTRLCIRAARAIDLDICGIDLMCRDIAVPLTEQGAVIELNAAPGIRMHEHPSEGKARDVGGAIVDHLFPSGATARIPITSVTGTNGKTTTTRLCAHLHRAAGATVGMTTTEGIYLDGELIEKGDTTGPLSASKILFDPTVEIAVLETARGGIVKRGLGYDWSDVGVITNIDADHIGQDGIESIDDLVRIKGLVAERVRPGGTIVLNADDERVVSLAKEPRVRADEKRVVYFSLRPDSEVVRTHLAAGGTAYVLEEGIVRERRGAASEDIVEAANVPCTIDGKARFQIANVMAAVAACRAQGLSVPDIVEGLVSFDAANDNPGRTNLYALPDGALVVLDYGHNPAAFSAAAKLANACGDRRRTCVASIPGDRRDDTFPAIAAAIASGFDRAVLKNDRNLRGRDVGQLPNALAAVLQQSYPQVQCSVVLEEIEALRHALDTREPNEIVFMFSDDIVRVTDLLQSVGAERTTHLPAILEGSVNSTRSDGRPSMSLTG